MKYETNVAICKALGLDPMTVKSILIRLSPIDAPRITVEYTGCAQALEGVLRDYRIEPLPPLINAQAWRSDIKDRTQ
jgi:hypothetical protein